MSQFLADRPDANTRREWSDAELNELGNMLVGGLTIEEMAHRLHRKQDDVWDKVVEIGRACGAEISARKQDSLDTLIGDHSDFEEG